MYKKAKCLNIFWLPEYSNRYFGKPVKFVVKGKAGKLVKLGNEKTVTIVGALLRLYLISERAREPRASKF